MARRFLFIMAAAPVGGLQAQEALDQILTTAAMEQEVALLFLDDGVFQLCRGANPEQACRKDVSLIYEALPIYDVDDIRVEAESLLERGLDAADLQLAPLVIPRSSVAAFVAAHDIVVTC